MRNLSERRRRTTNPALPRDRDPAQERWISFAGHGAGFHDCPLCRELASQGGGTVATEAIVNVSLDSLPELVRTAWLDDLIDLVGPNATVKVMGRDLESQPTEEISMATFLARLADK